MMNNILKNIPEEFHIFVIFLAITGFRTDLLPNSNRNTNH